MEITPEIRALLDLGTKHTRADTEAVILALVIALNYENMHDPVMMRTALRIVHVAAIARRRQHDTAKFC